jgi:cytoskeletal protein CcmA (bactofilin family)
MLSSTAQRGPVQVLFSALILTVTMQKLDLSLEIPGAPIVSHLVPDADSELDLDQPSLLHSIEHFETGYMTQNAGRVSVEKLINTRGSSRKTYNVNEASVHQQLHKAMEWLSQPDTLEVASAATLFGEVNCRSIHIKGELNGTLSSGGVVMLDPDAILKGTIRNAEFVIVAGTVAGSLNEAAIRCHGLVILAGSAKVIGHIQCHSVAIFEGACLVGTVQPLPYDDAQPSSLKSAQQHPSIFTALY